MLGGSMGFGQNYSVTSKSNLDFVFVIDPSKLDRLASKWFFHDRIPSEVPPLFKSGEINLFWMAREFLDITVNAFVYSAKGYVDFCLLNGDINGFIRQAISPNQTGYGFDGNPITFDRRVRPFGSGSLYSKPALVDGRYWGGPPRQDFFYSGHIMLENGTFLTDLEKQVWRSTISQLIKEHGPRPDLSRFSILHSHHTYQESPRKMPPGVVNQIRARTDLEFKAYRSARAQSRS